MAQSGRVIGAPMYGSSSHKILIMSKFYGCEIGINELHAINPAFRWLGNHRRELFRLELAGFIQFSDNLKNRWSITNAGVLYLYGLARDNHRRVINSADGN